MATYKTTLSADAESILNELGAANQAFMKRYPGDPFSRQPVHSVYGGAQLFKAETTGKLGELALRSLNEYAPDAFAFANALQLPGYEELPGQPANQAAMTQQFGEDANAVREACFPAWLALSVYNRVKAKLEREAVEDFRIDFEDGYGNRPDYEEDATAARTAQELARGMDEGILPPFIGIRIKTFTDELKARAARTLDIFVTTLATETKGRLPDNFVVTLPKVTIPEQVRTLVKLFEILEAKLGLGAGSLKMELMVEVTQSVMDHDGRSTLPLLLRAAEGRCVAAHFGTYDYTASCNITSADQTMDHSACDFALNMMKQAYAGTGIFLSDGATNVMPVAPNRAAAGVLLTDEQVAENHAAVHNAWRLALGHIRHSLSNGFYQGWDLHPAQLPVRYAACYAFFFEGFDAAAARLSNFVSKAAQATLVGDVFDDAATGQGLLNYFLRGLNCGAFSLEELARTGLTEDELHTRSFVKILHGRREQVAS